MNKHSSTLLSRRISVCDYRELETTEDRQAIADFILARFHERYLAPLDAAPVTKSGFMIMAISCLLIEALESFHQGLPNTEKKSKMVFRNFFSRWPEFGAIREHSDTFYKHVRCGILHQAETTGGWRIWRKGPLFDSTNKTVNASRFLIALHSVLSSYVATLAQDPWDSEIWNNLRRKMKAVCQNTVA